MLKKMRIKRRIVKRESDSPTFKICNGSQALEVKLPGVIYDTGESFFTPGSHLCHWGVIYDTGESF